MYWERLRTRIMCSTDFLFRIQQVDSTSQNGLLCYVKENRWFYLFIAFVLCHKQYDSQRIPLKEITSCFGLNEIDVSFYCAARNSLPTNCVFISRLQVNYHSDDKSLYRFWKWSCLCKAIVWIEIDDFDFGATFGSNSKIQAPALHFRKKKKIGCLLKFLCTAYRSGYLILMSQGDRNLQGNH